MVSKACESYSDCESQHTVIVNHSNPLECIHAAVRRCHLSILTIQAVVIEDIEIDRVKAWVDFLNPLELSLEDIDRNDISSVDARWNVNCVMSKWLNGHGSSPKTWGTLLDAMHSGNQFLRQLATRTEFKLLGD